jgi:cytoskeletal protein CcmA (bactofilin family)
MALITQVSTSNTFNDWLNTTISVVDTLNSLTDGGNASTFFVNTNLQIANNLFVGGNVVVTGNVTLDDIGFNDLIVSGNATVNGTITTANATINQLTVTGNIAQVNVTTSLNVANNTNVYGNLTVSQNATINDLTVNGNFTSSTSNVTVANLFVTQNVERLNVTTELDVGTDMLIFGNLVVFGSTTLSGLSSGNVSLTADFATINIANVNSLIGQANTEIYTYIDNTLGATANANLAVAFLAYSIIFG